MQVSKLMNYFFPFPPVGFDTPTLASK